MVPNQVKYFTYCWERLTRRKDYHANTVLNIVRKTKISSVMLVFRETINVKQMLETGKPPFFLIESEAQSSSCIIN